MNNWSRNRKRIIFLIIFLTLLVLVVLPAVALFYKTPDCFDGKQNGTEVGIDCGGSCALICRDESLPIIMKGDARVFRVASSTYGVVAIFENPNIDAEVYSAEYSIKLFNSSSIVPLKVIEGRTFVPKSGTFSIFDGPFILSEAPTKSLFEWKNGSLVWQKDIMPVPEVVISEKELTEEGGLPRLNMVISNLSLERVSHIELTALLSSEDGNIISASKTLVDVILPGQSVPAVITWPEPLLSEVASTDVLIRILPDIGFIR